MSRLTGSRHSRGADLIGRRAEAPPVELPSGYVGLARLPHGRMIWWTGRVAIGLLHEPMAGGGDSTPRDAIAEAP